MQCRRNFTYVFTTGGIGPTHDDITSDAIAKAFGVRLERNKEAEAMLERIITAARWRKFNKPRASKMADIPKGASLIANPVSAAPGFCIENVYVMAGVPDIMQAMFAHIRHELKGGAKSQLSKTVSAHVTEGVLALAEGLHRHPGTNAPGCRNRQLSRSSASHRLGTSLVARSTDAAQLEDVTANQRFPLTMTVK